MGSEYSADIDGILQGCSKLREAVAYSDRLEPEFDRGYGNYVGWWGEEGCDDDFANQVGPGCRREYEQARSAVGSISTGFANLIHAVREQAGQVQKPQDLALDDIHREGSQTERR
ncbi:hypothetical protein [Streptomyces sp. NBC_01320]|uniref:hypothetical protein n=1 Tax=Streptomyces sp. NBC_01320 TaxID=2903824 RepID=UPI002E0E72F1|nr:hypothetical protein OG395_56650 [Streptomyces sp. NBC_01320]